MFRLPKHLMIRAMQSYKYNSLIDQLFYIIPFISQSIKKLENRTDKFESKLNKTLTVNDLFSSTKRKLYHELNILNNGINNICLIIDNYQTIVKNISFENILAKKHLYTLIDELSNKCNKLKSNITTITKMTEEQFINTLDRYSSKEDMKSIDLSGTWKTIFGILIMNQIDNNITGYYTNDDGLIKGSINDNIFTAIWSERPTYSPPKDVGNVIATINGDSLKGKWGYSDKEPIHLWYADRVSKDFSGNCYRYRFVQSSPNLPTIELPNDILKYNQTTKYYYPKSCPRSIDIPMTISGNNYIKKVSLLPGNSYTLYIEGDLPDIEIQPKIDYM